MPLNESMCAHWAADFPFLLCCYVDENFVDQKKKNNDEIDKILSVSGKIDFIWQHNVYVCLYQRVADLP